MAAALTASMFAATSALRPDSGRRWPSVGIQLSVATLRADASTVPYLAARGGGTRCRQVRTRSSAGRHRVPGQAGQEAGSRRRALRSGAPRGGEADQHPQHQAGAPAACSSPPRAAAAGRPGAHRVKRIWTSGQ